MGFILGLFSGNKLITYGVLIACLLGAFGGTYLYGKHKGELDKETALKAEYEDILKQKLAQNTKEISTEYDAKLKAQSEKTRIETVYKDRIITVNKVVHDSKALNNPACTMEKSEVDQINELTQEVK